MQTSSDLEREFPGYDLAAQLAEIDNFLYNRNSDSTAWHGKSLLATVTQIKKSSAKKKKQKSTLQKLYK